MIYLNGRTTAKFLLEKELQLKEDDKYYYFSKRWFEKVKKDDYFKIDGIYAKVSKNKLWAW